MKFELERLEEARSVVESGSAIVTCCGVISFRCSLVVDCTGFCFEAGIQTWTLEWFPKACLYVQLCPVG